MLAQDYNKIDAWLDKAFVRVLVKKVQALDPDIGAVLYPDTKLIVFIKGGLIVYKTILNEENTDSISIEQHVENVKNMLSALKSGLIPVYTIKEAKKQTSKMRGGKKL